MGHKLIVIVLLFTQLLVSSPAYSAEKSLSIVNFKITAYCSCKKCCGKSDAITASGKKAKPNRTIALNWLPFGTRVLINGKQYVVEDRGAESLFGTYYHRKTIKSRIKHIDIYMSSHSEARSFGVKYLPVQILGVA